MYDLLTSHSSWPPPLLSPLDRLSSAGAPQEEAPPEVPGSYASSEWSEEDDELLLGKFEEDDFLSPPENLALTLRETAARDPGEEAMNRARAVREREAEGRGRGGGGEDWWSGELIE